LSKPQPIQQQQQQPSPGLSSLDLPGIAQYISSGRARNIVVLVGAGISVSAGIPDFRTPGSGLYCQLQKYNLPFPEAVFSLGFFRHNPKPFYMLAKELYPGQASALCKRSGLKSSVLKE
jgi:NAD-dependent deacetylase sirtuin 2